MWNLIGKLSVSPFQLEFMTFCVTLYIYSCSGPSDVARVFSGVGSEKLSGFFGAKTKTPGVLRRADIAKIFDETKNGISSD